MRDKKWSTKLWYPISESTSSQLIFYLRNEGTSIAFMLEAIFKTDIWTTLLYFSGVLSLRYKRHYWRFLAKFFSIFVDLQFSPNMCNDKGASANLRTVAAVWMTDLEKQRSFTEKNWHGMTCFTHQQIERTSKSIELAPIFRKSMVDASTNEDSIIVL